jgi:hypothetical protein
MSTRPTPECPETCSARAPLAGAAPPREGRRRHRAAAAWTALAAILLLLVVVTAPRAARAQTRSARAAAPGALYAVFVAVADYHGENRDLTETVHATRTLADALLRAGVLDAGRSVMLTDAGATVASVRRALHALAARVTPRDTLLFVFNGHGDRTALQVRGGSVAATQLAAWLDPIPGRQLLVLDSCRSGGMAWIARARPSRFGLFSSRADEPSYSYTGGVGGLLTYALQTSVRHRVPLGLDGAVEAEPLARYAADFYARLNPRGCHLVAIVHREHGPAVLWRVPGRSGRAS